MQEDSRDSFEMHNHIGHNVQLSHLPTGQVGNVMVQVGSQNQHPNNHHPNGETRPTVIESSQPHIIECT